MKTKEDQKKKENEKAIGKGNNVESKLFISNTKKFAQ